MNKIKTSILLFFALLGISTLNSVDNANAISPYDGLLAPLNQAITQSSWSECSTKPINLSTNWFTVASSQEYNPYGNNNPSVDPNAINTIADSLQNGGKYFVFENKYELKTQIYFSSDQNSKLEFYTDNWGSPTLKLETTNSNTKLGFIQISSKADMTGQPSDCDIPIITNAELRNTKVELGQWQPAIKTFLNSFPTEFPVGYEGYQPPLSYTPPSVYPSPDLELTSGSSREVTINDNNYNTFDPVAFTCDNDLAPVIRWQLYKNNTDPDPDQFIFSGSQSPTATISFLVSSIHSGEFTFLSWYDCGGEPIIDSDQSRITFNIQPLDQAQYTPDFYISSILDNKAKFHDKNFNTFDDNPFTCTDETAPVLHYEIHRNSTNNILITSGVQSATAEINYDFGPAESQRDYTLLGWYDCGPNDVLQFTDQGRLQFSITTAGSQVFNLFEECLSADFPFIHPEQCYENILTILNLLVFGEVKLPSFSFNPACHSLYMMDDWLNLPNGYQVCPQIPAFVRNVTTPFVAFMLGLITFGWLQKRNIGDF